MAEHVYRVGDRVRFEGRDGVITTATEPKANLFGIVDQTLTVETYGGKMSTLVGSRHSMLIPAS